MDWDKLKEEYINTKTTYKKLAEKYGISVYSLRMRAASDKWFEEKKKTNPDGIVGYNDNLTPINKRPIEEQRAIRVKAGEASAQSRKERKKARECIEEILSCEIQEGKVKEMLKKLGISDKNLQNSMLLMFSLFQNGVKTGDAGTIKTIFEIAGDLNVQQEQQAPTINITVSAATAEDIEDD